MLTEIIQIYDLKIVLLREPKKKWFLILRSLDHDFINK